MVLITPRLVRPLNPDEVPALPTNIRPLIKRGDIGQQLDGAGGVADAPIGQEEQRGFRQEVMIAHRTSGVAGERGAVLIQVAVAILALLALRRSSSTTASCGSAGGRRRTRPTPARCRAPLAGVRQTRTI